ncbi:MAG: cyclodeaminase/cyclohydrolase family protein [Candidatus Omnitrophica bacterium]|nr:cyclodeaminase/cyclohydrolase family protein [Candidatus Omnitrophota bacterium]MBI5024739.1 cyclodeaminase/cyclohydrolase family protein [Candidatus Omnitrophota bacterium]
MKPFRNYSLSEYSRVLSLKVPAPGGGSAAAATAALGAALLSMAANYSLGRTASRAAEQKIKASLKQSEQLRKRFLQLVDLDARAYLNVVKTRKAAPAKRAAARRKAAEVPLEICKLCYKAVQLSPTLVRYGNKYLISDVKVALELLLAAFNAAKLNVEINQ